MIHQELLRGAIAAEDVVLGQFVETLGGAILKRLATVPALGGSGKPLAPPEGRPRGLEPFPPEALERFSAMHDQSMATHIFNGAFAAMRIARKLPPAKALSELEQKVWLLAYVVHDYGKVYGGTVRAGDVPGIREAIGALGESLGFVQFLPGWKDYLDDIAFLAQNTQTVEGANLDVSSFRLRLPLRRLEVLRLLASYADILAHITSPADVVHRGSDGRDRATNLREKLAILFGAGSAPTLAYHRLREVRGLLTNVVNNVVMQELTARGYEPYLFFPNGVVYLRMRVPEEELDVAGLAERAWAEIERLVGESEGFGVLRGPTGLRVSSALLDLVGLPGGLAAGRRAAMRIVTGHAVARLYGFFTGESVNDVRNRLGDAQKAEQAQEALVREKGLPHDVRVDRLGEFLSFAYRTVREWSKGLPDPAEPLLAALGLAGSVSPAEAKQQKGGTYFGWYYAAARYIERHPGIDDAEIDELLGRLSDEIVAWVEEKGALSQEGAGIRESVTEYIRSLIEMGGVPAPLAPKPEFAAELTSYMHNKDRGRALCALCSTPFDSVFQEAVEVPFGNQQYSNRNPLSESKVKRGTCPVCRMEMILRRVQLPALDEGQKPIHVYIYPVYFFTPETALAVKRFLRNLQDLDHFALLRHLHQRGFTAEAIVDYEGFASEEEDARRFSVLQARYSEHDAPGLVSVVIRPLGRKPTDTDAWVGPALYALLLPVLLNVKTVVTPSFVPLFATAAEFRETAILDGPHAFARHVLGRDRFRVDEVGDYLIRLLRLYDLHVDVFAERGDMHWAQLNTVAKDLATDPLYVFAYYDRKGRKREQEGRKGGGPSGIAPWDLQRYTETYYTLGGEPGMGIIGEIVDSYAQFYRARFDRLDSAHAVLRPLMTAIEVTVDSDPETSFEDLVLLVAGAVNDDQERVRGGQADGFDPIATNKELGSYPERIALSRRKVEEFARLFLDKVFVDYCQGDRAMLRERANRIRSAARFYYQQHYGRQNKEVNHG
ncbi:MAG: type I-D CRISPR-associated protein Cas10d/Csc3 [Anaerolineae bacterium]|nr:type I-D CRISPR-associated protein Cas10d/Csc3 [Anaerolineae bacterium]